MKVKNKYLFSLLVALFVFVPFKNVKAISAAKYITDLAATDTVNMATDDPGNNPRYIGTNPNNYVEFNGEEWRIIGVIDGKVKLIRSDYLETGYAVYSWDTSDRNVNRGEGINYWPQADLMTELNTDYLNSSLSEDVYWYSNMQNVKNSIFDHTKVIKSNAQEMIADATWYLGSGNYDGTTLYDSESLTAAILYANERLGTAAILNPGTNESNDGIMDRDKTWTGKVALPYTSDFMYSTSGNSTTTREQCLNTVSWNSDCNNNTWLKTSYDLWTITPATTSGKNIYVYFFYSGMGDAGLVAWPTNKKTKPAIYLKDNVIIYDGDGTRDNSYKLALANIVEFDSDGGSDVTTQYIEANGNVVEPDDPTKDGNTFLGWYTEAGDKYDFTSEVVGNMTLYARWKANETTTSSASTTDAKEEDNKSTNTNDKNTEKGTNPKTVDRIKSYVMMFGIGALLFMSATSYLKRKEFN